MLDLWRVCPTYQLHAWRYGISAWAQISGFGRRRRRRCCARSHMHVFHAMSTHTNQLTLTHQLLTHQPLGSPPHICAYYHIYIYIYIYIELTYVYAVCVLSYVCIFYVFYIYTELTYVCTCYVWSEQFLDDREKNRDSSHNTTLLFAFL